MASKIPEADLSLLQTADPRKQMVQKMRRKMAGGSEEEVKKVGRRKVRARKRFTVFLWQAGLVGALVGVNIVAFERKDYLLGHLGVGGLPRLAPPEKSLGPDEKALYYTYALFDFDKLQQRFAVPADIVIDGNAAKSALKELMPRCAPATLREISTYMSAGGAL